MSGVDGVRIPSPEQLRMLAFWADGKTIEQIAAEECFSVSTVRWRLKQAKNKVGARTLSHALVICVACGYLCIDGRNGAVFVPDDLNSLVA